jgi:sec-independent protein translocase protein TatA
MALAGYEWIIVAGVLIVFFLWGPNKIPDLARAIGQAKREFDTASKELTNPLASGPASGPAWTSAPTQPMTSADDALITTAKKLGITTEGKNRDEISNEILQKASANKSPPAPPVTLQGKA